MKVTVEEVIELINTDTVFHAKELANKTRCAVYDRNNKKCAEIAYRNKTATFSIALQCNRFDSKKVKEVILNTNIITAKTVVIISLSIKTTVMTH